MTAEEFIDFAGDRGAKHVDLKITSSYTIRFTWQSQQARKTKSIHLSWLAPKWARSSDSSIISIRDNDGPTAEAPRLSAAIQRYAEEKGKGVPMVAEELLDFTEGHPDANLSLSSYKNLKYKFLFPSRVRVDWHSEVDAKDKFCVLTFAPYKPKQGEGEHAGFITDALHEVSSANKDLPEERWLCDIARSFFNEKGRLPLTTGEFVAFAETRFSVSAYKDLKVTSQYSITFDWYSEETGESELSFQGYFPPRIFRN